MLKLTKNLILCASVLGAILPVAFAQADTTTPDNSPMATVCIALANIMPCAGSNTTSTSSTASTTSTSKNQTTSNQSSEATTPKRSFLGSLFAFFFGSSENSSSGFQTATIIEGFGGGVNHTKDAIILVQAPGSNEVYRIMGGKRFLIPTKADNVVFNSYNFNQIDIIPMNHETILTYPRVKFVTVVGTSTKTVYYLTEGGMLRRIANKKVFDSYADVDHDIALINAVEFSLYPKNQYIFNEETLVAGQRPQIYLISDMTKQAIDYDQLRILGVLNSIIAPVNQIEFDSYKTLKGTTVLSNSLAPTQTNSSQKITTQYN